MKREILRTMRVATRVIRSLVERSSSGNSCSKVSATAEDKSSTVRRPAAFGALFSPTLSSPELFIKVTDRRSKRVTY